MVGISRFPKSLNSSSALQNFDGNKELASNNLEINDSSQKEEEEEEEEDEHHEDDDCDGDGDEEMGIEALKKALKIEREQKNAATSELEKERTSAASAANEAMAMILRLQNEKSSREIEANQYRRLTEQKQQYDQEEIRSLQWVIYKHELERSILENQLKLCKEKLNHYLKIDELEEFDQVLNCCCSSIEDDFADSLVSSLDMDSSLM
ncbi:Zein-binding domain [Macleaya cordata]|uniref:Zein-binding domain n=1 Tax=Macleaya cordata TaxID=56857 RepID=A0A200QXS6_MACCD|nr:Zein-binding domain [Macleaya cordata]